jgi:hypothetical protein
VLSKKQLYSIILILSFIAIAWISAHLISWNSESKMSFEVCYFKKTTGFACPSCGSTRAAVSIFKGDFKEALFWNPLGYLLALIVVVLPPWILVDILLKKSSFYVFFQKSIQKIKKPKVFIMLICFWILNWIWNLIKNI